MKSSIIFKGVVALFFVGFLPEISLASGGKPNIVFSKTLMNSFQDTTLPASEQKVVNVKDKQEVQVIKVLPKAHRQPIPVPVKIKVNVPKVKAIKPVVKPVIKILH
ncbi:hypothetical protein EFY79_02340 [Hanamia caeni]|jgi:hypothetical protein|uniref:Uncharacterized protein n=1 Tax=Hanamia caeni TaxID=2294116 RepID=A0A3M9NSD0_9BACT|nr:hypothetical protein [Hanamia caeni]RNI40157.1 hypothetical protein EFY79_02340 [Hanamia caeni]